MKSHSTDSAFANMAVILKLVSGETVVCKVLSDTETNLLIENPYQVNVLTERSTSGIKTMLYYSSWFSGSKVSIHILRKDAIMCVGLPDQDTIRSYNAALEENGYKPADTPIKNSPTEMHPDWDGDLNFKPENDEDLSRN